MVNGVSGSASVFAEATPRQVRLRSMSLGLRLRATTPQDDGTRQPNILSRQLSANNNHPDNGSGLCCQYRFLEVELRIWEEPGQKVF